MQLQLHIEQHRSYLSGFGDTILARPAEQNWRSSMGMVLAAAVVACKVNENDRCATDASTWLAARVAHSGGLHQPDLLKAAKFQEEK